MNNTLVRINLRRASALVLALAGFAAAAEQPAVRTALLSPKERKPAPHFMLPDGSGRTVTLKNFRGKVVLLNFWATWCGGCKQEISWFADFQSWFADFQRAYGGKRFAVVGVSLDDGGWSVVRPFLV